MIILGLLSIMLTVIEILIYRSKKDIHAALRTIINISLLIVVFLLKAAEINWYHDNYELSF